MDIIKIYNENQNVKFIDSTDTSYAVAEVVNANTIKLIEPIHGRWMFVDRQGRYKRFDYSEPSSYDIIDTHPKYPKQKQFGEKKKK
ncbi:hypothetical protein ACNGTO_03260 [Bisgaard Taxon 45]